LLNKVNKLKFSTNLIKLLSFFPSERKFTISVEGEMSTPREMEARAIQGSVPFPKFYSMNIDNSTQTGGVCPALFADDTCIDATDRKVTFLDHCSAV
jgi:hypothetical protein